MSDPVTETKAVPLYSSASAAAAPVEATETSTQPAASSATPVMSLKDAVHNCRRAYQQTLAADLAKGVVAFKAEEHAAQAYRTAMPFLTSEGNIQAFIACAAHAALIKTIRAEEAVKLMSIARAALVALPRQQSPRGRPARKAQDGLPEK
ncbi:hypothetical protein [Occallatibacter riparius]|uniref:Uncharacterized protein n=1 Tax=Occallatibacter riparius TaxID=1002689 RepID=A0A9J7BRY8_9BACT|nr:hypothetical protein [Occallatibacter riparius]UWZ85335.1 hypothetical protein MOP44_05200 [Occallatibacter riparius]